MIWSGEAGPSRQWLDCGISEGQAEGRWQGRAPAHPLDAVVSATGQWLPAPRALLGLLPRCLVGHRARLTACALFRADDKQEGLEPRWARVTSCAGLGQRRQVLCYTDWTPPPRPFARGRDTRGIRQSKGEDRLGTLWVSVEPRALFDLLSLGLCCLLGRWLV